MIRIPGHLLLACLVAVVAAGCLSERGADLLRRQPSNRTFVPGEVPDLPEGRSHFLAEFDVAGNQGICYLRLAPDAVLTKRYHKRHDLTLVAVRGSAVVKVEGTRYFVEPGGAVLLPRLTAYMVMPHRTEEDFVALLVYSPPFDGEDAVLGD